MAWRAVLTNESGRSSDDPEPQFKDLDREGADALVGADYAEVEKFKVPVLDALKQGKLPAGYFCATCEYYRHDYSKKYEGYCEELKAEDAAWGCCNLWRLNPAGKVKETR